MIIMAGAFVAVAFALGAVFALLYVVSRDLARLRDHAVAMRSKLDDVGRRLDIVVAKLEASAITEGLIMTLTERMQAAIAAANEATNNIAADIRGLKDKLQAALDAAGVSTPEAAALADELDALAARLTGVAAETPDAEGSTPTPPVAPPAEPPAAEPPAEPPAAPPAGGDGQ